MADGISDVSLVEFIPKERNYLDGVINKDFYLFIDIVLSRYSEKWLKITNQN